ncbi:p066 [Rhizobium phage 16-3]|uniref:p066 n=1 Tax=Rhizobium phage 16-3 TaxID=10704 RepID=UPI00017BA613|nr:p066 [Rhizobium phage 16-3]ABF71320.1 p066 [Rhizobium phage 16-3]
MTDRELKPCPFCGGDAERVDIAEGENAGGSCISCTACQASGNVEFGYKENFVSNWNRRASLYREWVEVKQLEWKFLSTPPSGEEYASTSLGTYFIQLDCKRFPVKLHSYQIGTYDTLEAAKAAAQADFASRIRSCLLDKPDGRGGSSSRDGGTCPL